jgi:hypothetical protein
VGRTASAAHAESGAWLAASSGQEAATGIATPIGRDFSFTNTDTGKDHRGESMKITFYILFVILALSEMVSTANASTVMGPISCKQWQDRKSNPAAEEAYIIWLQGYLSGANAMYGEMVDRDFIKDSDRISIIDWTDVYCRKYPKSMLHDSTNALIRLLKRDLPF